MTIIEALSWITKYYEKFDNAPTTYGQSDAWILEAGEQCKKAIQSGTSINDESVRKKLNMRAIPVSAVI